MSKMSEQELNNLLSLVKMAYMSGSENSGDLLQNIAAGSFSTQNNGNTIPKLSFTQKEIDKMPKTFKKEFRVDGSAARVRKRLCGKNCYTYTIRYRKNGYNVEVTNKNLETAKKLFIEKLKTAEKAERTVSTTGTPLTFNSFALYYFEKFRQKKVAKETFRGDMYRYEKYLKPYFKEKLIKNITPGECQQLLDEIAETGKDKTVAEVRGLLSVIFKTAILHGIIQMNPLNIVLTKTYERKHGTALTKEEEKLLITSVAQTDYAQCFALLLYCGLRPNELETVQIEDKFVVAKNSKRKNGKIEYKKIPISKMLAPFVVNKTIRQHGIKALRYQMYKILPNHILYDLRTTFYTRLKECNVADNAINEFVGHSLGALGNTYTDLSDEYLLKEGAKYEY